jgi:hypothetical protein
MLKVVLSNRPILHTLNVTVILTFNPCRSLSLLKKLSSFGIGRPGMATSNYFSDEQNLGHAPDNPCRAKGRCSYDRSTESKNDSIRRK